MNILDFYTEDAERFPHIIVSENGGVAFDTKKNVFIEVHHTDDECYDVFVNNLVVYRIDSSTENSKELVSNALVKLFTS